MLLMEQLPQDVVTVLDAFRQLPAGLAAAATTTATGHWSAHLIRTVKRKKSYLQPSTQTLMPAKRFFVQLVFVLLLDYSIILKARHDS